MKDRLVVIIGGGGVASRKAEGLLDAGATRIRMVATSFSMDCPKIDFVNASYDPAHLEGAGLVFAATDSSRSNTQCSATPRPGILACRADSADDEPGDFVTPAN